MSSLFQSDFPLDGSGDDSTVDSGVTESIESSVEESIEVSHGDFPDMSQNGAYRMSTIFSTGPSLPRVAGPLTKLAPSSSHLPNLETHQHSTLFYLSLIEGRCRTQAAGLLNAGRHPTDQLAEDHEDVCALARPLFAGMSKELHKAGILPDDFAGQDLEDLRAKYLNTFDTALQNIAAKAAHTIPDQSLPGPSLPFDALSISRPLLHPAMDKMTKRSGSPALQPSLFSSLMLRSSGGDQSPNSIFQTQYGPKTLLGRGGFGNVYRVKNLVDDREYAIKRIVIRSKKLNQPGHKNHHHTILMEARSLSKLNHQNIIRYYGAWVEACPVGTKLEGDPLSGEVS
jgi:translation initiation factor 2-alpha kinase 3